MFYILHFLQLNVNTVRTKILTDISSWKYISDNQILTKYKSQYDAFTGALQPVPRQPAFHKGGTFWSPFTPAQNAQL